MTESMRTADPYRDTRFDPNSPAARRILESIVVTPRDHLGGRVQPKRRALVVAAAALGAVAAALAVLIVAGSADGPHHQPVTLAGYRVSTQPDGAVKVVVRWNEVKDPAALQASLDRAHARTKIWVTSAPNPTQWCTGPLDYYQGRLDTSTVQYSTPDGATGLIIRPRRFPPGVTFLITVELRAPRASAAAPSGTQPAKMNGYATAWVTGSPPNCT